MRRLGWRRRSAARRAPTRLATAVVVAATVGLGPAAPAAVATTGIPDGPATVAHPCADPADCRLREAGAVPGVHIGMLVRPEVPAQAEIGAREADTVVNHGISWDVVEPTRGTLDWSNPDRVAAYARAHGMRQVGMHLWWDQAGLDDLPDWVLGITDPTELREVLRQRARAVFGRYPDLASVDVLNEPLVQLGAAPYDNHFRRVLGPGYAIELFRIAAEEAPPGAELFLNENLVEYQARKADALVAFVTELVEAGAPIDAVGLQAHLIGGEPRWDLLARTMARLDALGVRVRITELDVPVPPTVADRQAVQAERYRRMVATCLAVPSCDEITVWGVSDRDSWLDWFLGPDQAPLLFDRDLRPKPAYDAVRDALLAGRPAPTTTTPPTTTSPATGPDATTPTGPSSSVATPASGAPSPSGSGAVAGPAPAAAARAVTATPAYAG